MTLKLLARFLNFDGSVWRTLEARDPSDYGLWSINLENESPDSAHYLDAWSAPAYKGGTLTLSPGQTNVYVGTLYSSAMAGVLASYGKDVGLSGYYGVATFTPIGGQNTATLHYDTQGGTPLDDTVIRHGTKTGNITVTIPSTVPTREDYTFQHWYYNGGTYSPGSSISIAYNAYATLTAVWKRTTYYTTVIYDNNGGSGSPNQQVEPHQQTSGNVTVYLNNDTFPTKSGWLFGGWTVKGEVKSPGSAITLAYNETVTVFAYWYQNSATITYDTAGSDPLDSTVVKNAQTAGTVPVTIRADTPLKKYYLFTKWKDAADAQYNAGQTVNVAYNGTLALTAQYERLKITVYLNSERGSGPTTAQVDQGSTYTLPSQSEDGWVFKGWAETDGGAVRYQAGYALPIETNDVILYAVWNLKFNEETILLANGNTVYLKDITWYPADQRTQEIGAGTSDVLLDALGYPGIQFVPRSLVEAYPVAFGISPSDMSSPENPDLEYANVLSNGVLTVKFFEQVGGYNKGSVKLAVFDVPSMTGFILGCYLSQETDVTNYTIKLMKSESDTSPTVITGLTGSYRNPAMFTFPLITEGDKVLDKWKAKDNGLTYNAGDTLTLTGRYITAEQVLTFVAQMATKTTVLKFALQGGRNGPGSITKVSETAASFTIPAITPTRRGYTFRGWTSTSNGTPEWSAGDSVTVSAGSVQVLYASWQAITSPFSVQGDLYLPYCGIRIWKNATAYFNATFYQVEGGLAVISKAENRPGSATFTLANDYGTPARSLCSPSFAQWSDGSTGEITTGMYVELLDIRSKDDASLNMDGRITTMTPNGDTVSFEVGDGITFLSKTGSWLRRNYREIGETQEHDIDGYIEDGALKVNIGQYEGTPSAVYRYKTEEVSIPLTRGEKQGTIVSTTFSGTARKTVEGSTYTRIRKIRFKVRWDIIVEYGFAMVAPILKITTPDRTYDKTFHSSEIYDSKGSKVYEYSFGGIFTGDVSISINSNVSGQNYGDQYVEDCYIYADKSEVVTVTSQQYVDSTPDSYDLADPSARLHVVYEKGSVTIPALMKMIAEAIGYGVDIPEDIHQKKLAIFRAGGSYAQTYLQKLADQSEEGRAYSYYVEGASPTLRIGARYLINDPPQYIAKYGGDTAPSGYDATVINIADFAPKKTLKNRPNLVTLKASLQEGQSITVCFENPSSTDARDGLTIEKIVTDSSASSIEGVGSAAYAELMSTDLDQWEGEMTLPGILWGMLSEGDPNHAGSGVPILIKDSRFGMDSFRTRVRQVTYDYNACTTKVILGNYDLQYSSGIANTNALAVEVSDMVGGISDTTLYNQQHVYVKAVANWSPGFTNKITLYAVNGAQYDLDTAQVFELPDGSYIVVGTIKSDATRFLPATSAYGVVKVGLSGNSTVVVDIPEARRPDFYLGQTLTVCVMLTKS